MGSMDFIPNEKIKGLKWTALSWLTAKFLIFHFFFFINRITLINNYFHIYLA